MVTGFDQFDQLYQLLQLLQLYHYKPRTNRALKGLRPLRSDSQIYGSGVLILISVSPQIFRICKAL